MRFNELRSQELWWLDSALTPPAIQQLWFCMATSRRLCGPASVEVRYPGLLLCVTSKIWPHLMSDKTEIWLCCASCWSPYTRSLVVDLHCVVWKIQIGYIFCPLENTSLEATAGYFFIQVYVFYDEDILEIYLNWFFLRLTSNCDVSVRLSFINRLHDFIRTRNKSLCCSLGVEIQADLFIHFQSFRHPL